MAECPSAPGAVVSAPEGRPALSSSDLFQASAALCVSIDQAVAYIAEEIGVARFGSGGEESKRGHVAWLEFTHATSRRVVSGHSHKGFCGR